MSDELSEGIAPDLGDEQLRALVDDLFSREGGAEKLLTEMGNDELLDFVRLDLKAAAL